MARNTDQVVDEILVLDSQSGSREALDLLVSRWHSRLLRHAFYLTGDSNAAWEIAQESWLAVIRGISSLDDPAKFAPWVLKIVTHKSRDWINKRKKAPQLSAAPFDEPKTNNGNITDCDIAIDVHDVIETLPVDLRAVLNLFYIEERDVAEIAEALSIPAGTVKSRLHAGRMAFKRIWISKSRLQSATDDQRKS